MELHQSALNFDFAPEEKKPGKKAVQVEEVSKVDKVEKVNKVDDEVRELEFLSAKEPAKEQRIKVIKERKSTRGRMKLSDMNAEVGLIEVPSDEILFQKSYYSIGSVSKMFKVNISLIRFWENEFDVLKPKKNGKGDRHFRPEDVVNLKLIYHLLRERKYTIEGAKEFLKKNKKAAENFDTIEALQKIKLFLNELKANF
ncbi:MAG: MerR family transcriptional regulator [Ferruginibacter sp.]